MTAAKSAAPAAEAKAETKTAPKTAKTTKTAAKTAAKKTATKTAAKTASKTTAKTAAKTRTATAKKAVDSEVFVQFSGIEVAASGLTQRVTEIFTKEMGKKAADLKDIRVYVNADEAMAYYVINGEITGSFAL